MTTRLVGVLAPVITPFDQDLRPDAPRFTRHCRWLLAHGCRGLAVFGTNSEANSLSVEERVDLLDSLVLAGVPRTRSCRARVAALFRTPCASRLTR